MQTQRIRVFSNSAEKERKPVLEFIEKTAPFNLAPIAELVSQLLILVTGLSPLRAQVFYVTEAEPDQGKLSHGTETGTPPNVCPVSSGIHGIRQIAYDDVQLVIDRTISERIDIRVWRTLESDPRPCAAFSLSLEDFVCPTCGDSDVGSAECSQCERCILCCPHEDARSQSGPFHVVRDLDTGHVSIWPLKRILAQINRGRSDYWSKFTVHNWEAGWQEYVEGDEYELLSPVRGFRERDEARAFRAKFDQDPKDRSVLAQVYDSLSTAIELVCDRDTQFAIAREYRRRIVIRSEGMNLPASDWLIKATEVYRGIDADVH